MYVLHCYHSCNQFNVIVIASLHLISYTLIFYFLFFVFIMYVHLRFRAPFQWILRFIQYNYYY